MIIFSHLFIPHTDSIHKKVHSVLITVFLAAAADIYDFAEYQNEHHIVDYINMNVLYGFFKFSSIHLLQLLKFRLL